MLHMLPQNECPVRCYACLCVCVLQHGAKGERLPATKFTQPILSAAWVGNVSIICSLHAVYVLYKGYRIPLEYPPTYPSITPSLYCQYFPIEIRSAPFKTSNRNRQWRNLETFSLIDLFAHVYVLCVWVCLPRCLRRLYLYHLLFLTDLKCLGKRFFWSNVSFPSSAPTSFVDIVNLTQNTLAKAFTNYDLIACCLNPTTTTATTRRVTTKKNNKLEEIISELSGLGNTL